MTGKHDIAREQASNRDFRECLHDRFAFVDNPVPERLDGGSLQVCLRTHDVIRVLAVEHLAERPDQSLIFKMFGNKNGRSERDALAVNCRLNQYIGIVENGTVPRVHIVGPCELQPFRPILIGRIVQQRVVT
jgi:hypothetical protein